jgi:hypothetical protein
MSKNNDDSSEGNSGSGAHSDGSDGVEVEKIAIEIDTALAAKLEGISADTDVKYYDNVINDFKANEQYTLNKLERMKKEA